MNKDFITVLPDSGGGNSPVNVTATANTGAARSSSITISGSGATKTLPISQESSPSVQFQTATNPTPTEIYPAPPVSIVSGEEISLESYSSDSGSLKGKTISLFFDYEPFITNETIRGVSFLKFPDSIQISYGNSISFPDFIEKQISFKGGSFLTPLKIKLKP